MKIENNKVVSLVYELRERNHEGRVIEVLDNNRPLKFIFGSGRLLPGFEANLLSMGDGDNFKFALPADHAYGERREDMIIDIPLETFMRDGKLDEEICRVGNEVPMVDTEGNTISGTINEITDTSVRMDFNHPMAGIDLFFSGKVVDVRDATAQEIAGLDNSCSSCGSSSGAGCSGSCS